MTASALQINGQIVIERQHIGGQYFAARCLKVRKQ
jgi:hypothetical protein